jgi:hypothetical protein
MGSLAGAASFNPLVEPCLDFIQHSLKHVLVASAGAGANMEGVIGVVYDG